MRDYGRYLIREVHLLEDHKPSNMTHVLMQNRTRAQASKKKVNLHLLIASHQRMAQVPFSSSLLSLSQYTHPHANLFFQVSVS